MTTALKNTLRSKSIRSIIRRYQAGESSIAIAATYGVSSSTIIRVLRELGVKIKTRGRYPQ